MRLHLNIVVPVAGARGLYAALAALVALDRVYLQAHPRTPALYESGVRYLRDAEHATQGTPDAELWLTIPDCLRAGGADCKVLSAWRVAELLEGGERARPHVRAPRAGSGTWHVQVKRGDGSIEDPSRLLGMRGAA